MKNRRISNFRIQDGGTIQFNRFLSKKTTFDSNFKPNHFSRILVRLTKRKQYIRKPLKIGFLAGKIRFLVFGRFFGF
jgi:hypothetical protein